MSGVFLIEVVEADKVLGPVVTGVVLKGSLTVGMQAKVENQVLTIKEIDDPKDTVIMGQTARLALTGASFSFIKSLEKEKVEFSDLLFGNNKKIVLKPAVA